MLPRRRSPVLSRAPRTARARARGPSRTQAIARAVAITLASALLGAAAKAAPPKLQPTVTELFETPFMIHAEISPSGRHAASIYHGERGWGVRIERLDNRHEVDVRNDGPNPWRFRVERILWDGPDSLIVQYGPDPERETGVDAGHFELIRLEPKGEDVTFERRVLKTKGTIVDPSPDRPDEVLFVHAAHPNAIHRTSLRRLEYPLDSWKDVDPREPDAPVLLATLDDLVLGWLVDREGVVRAALALSPDPTELRLWYRPTADARWRIVRRETEVDHFDDLIPLGFSADGGKLLVASALERDRYGLYEYDPATDRVGRLLYEHPTAELVGLVFDAEQREVIAAVYVEDGEQRYAYLSRASDELRQALSTEFRDSIVAITGMSADRRRLSLFVSRSDDPGGYVAYDLDAKTVNPLGRVAPWLDDNRLAPVEVLHVPTAGGAELEAFLTLPTEPVAKPPMVVMPHGGPIGMADLHAYSPDVQYLARSGFAVLQVNYRGSGGRGRRFQEAGHRQWGRGIEDDVEAAVERVLATGRVDGDRLCAVGASYGGYSALMMVIRSPRRYRCAASLSGVTDIALMFNIDEVVGGEYLTSQMTKIVGDPDENYDEMRRYSPVYHADRIEVPVYLAHGEWDRRVDLDHLVRMKLALELEGADVKTTVYPKMGHGFESRDAAVGYWLSLYEFLSAHLNR